MKFSNGLGWLMILTYAVRCNLGPEHVSREQIPVVLVCGPIGGLVRRPPRVQTARRGRNAVTPG